MPRTRPENWFEPDELDPTTETWDFPLERQRARKRVALSSTVVLLFFAGAAFTAGAGDLTSKTLQGGDECAQQANASDLSADNAACDVAAAPEAEAAAPADAAPADPAAAPADPAAAPADPAAAPADPAAAPDPSAAAAPSAVPAADDEPQAANLGSTARAKSSSAAAPTAAPAGDGGNTAGEPVGAPSRSAVSRAKVVDNAKPVLKTAPAPAVPQRQWQAPTKGRTAPPPEIEKGDGIATVWLNRALPDPTPPAKRLTGNFAAALASNSKRVGVDWALALGVLRASGEAGSKPATPAELHRLTARLSQLGAAKDEWQAVLALDGHTDFADQAIALAHYNRAVGLWALVHGLEAAKEPMTERILKDPQISIYAGGRSDLAQGRVDVRVVALIAYLRESFGQVTISCLISGHRLYARPGVISAHIFGRALDIASLGGTTILGHQQTKSVTESAIRDILLLPSELQPQQVISLIGLGGPSFPLANHYDHIHVGY
jgi:hypothetical protein